MLPLYRLSSEDDWDTLINSRTAHPGLLYDKYPNQWSVEHHEKLPDEAKSIFFDKTVQAIKAIREEKEHQLNRSLKHKVKQHKSLVNAQKGIKLELQTDWRLIIGMGNAHPYETGLTWHPTLGVPYLPGSSIKGLLREWITTWTEEGQPEADRLLGISSETNEKDQIGSIIIFDAIPVTVPELEVDILNPHYQPYYDDRTKPPADYYSPVPVKFLTIAPGQEFLFSIAPCSGRAVQDDIKACKKYLSAALKTLGIGSKTAVGYGGLAGCLDNFRNELNHIDEKTLSEMFGKNIKETKNIYEEKGCDWNDIISILLDKKISVISCWSVATRNSAKNKWRAYKELKPYF